MKQRLVFQRTTSAWSFHVDSRGVCCVCYSGYGPTCGTLWVSGFVKTRCFLCCSMISDDMNIELLF